MTPPRHTLVFIPPNSGITRKNLMNLNRIMFFLENNSYELEHNMFRRYLKEVYNRIKQAGGHATRNNAKRVTARPLELYRALARKHPENTMHYSRQNAQWRKFQEAAGRFKAMGKVAAMRKSGNNASPSRRHLGAHNLHALATFMKPYMLSTASPVQASRAHYKHAEQKLARNAAARQAAVRRQRNARRARNETAAETAQRQSAPTTRSGRKSIAPKPLSPTRRRR